MKTIPETLEDLVRHYSNELQILRETVTALEVGSSTLEMVLAASTLASATTCTVTSRPSGLTANAGWIVIDPYTSECEVRLITAISGNTFTHAALTYAHAAGDPVLWMVEPVVNARWLGARGDGSTNDFTALQRATTQAIGISGELYLPQGTYAVTMTTGATLMDCTTAIEIWGDGVDRTIIAFSPNAPSITYFGIKANATSGTCVIRDLTLQGPATIGSAETQAIQSPSSKNNDVLIQRVKITQNWDFGIQMSNSTRTVTMRDCWTHGYYGCMNASTAAGQTNRLHCYNSYFDGIEDTASTRHTLYLNPGLNLIFQGCRFADMPSGSGYVFHLFGSDLTVPDYVIIQDCIFESNVDGSGAILTNPNGDTRVIGCSFTGLTNVAITCQNDAVIEACGFVDSKGVLVTEGYTRMNSCRISGNDLEGVNVKVNGTLAVVTNCIFEDTVLLIDNAVTTGRLQVSNSQFIGDGVVAGIRNYDGLVDVDNCNFYGTFGTSAVYNGDTGSTTGYCNLTNCGFYNSSGDAVNYQGLSNSLFAENCYFGRDVKITGSVIHNVKQRKALNPSTVASAATIVLSANYDVFHITGTTTIDTMQPGANNAAVIPMFNGTRVHIIPDGAFAFGNAGNVIATAGARTVNDMILFVYDATTNKWYEEI